MTTSSRVSRAVPIEEIVSLLPFVVRRRIAFRDCDPAGIVYTPRFLDPISTSAIELFVAELIGPYGDRDEDIAGLDLPAKAVNLVFHDRVRYGDLIDLKLTCSRIGTTTFDIRTAGRSLDATPLFDASLTSICVRRDPYRAVPVPGYLKEKLQPYLGA